MNHTLAYCSVIFRCWSDTRLKGLQATTKESYLEVLQIEAVQPVGSVGSLDSSTRFPAVWHLLLAFVEQGETWRFWGSMRCLGQCLAIFPITASEIHA